MELASAPLAVRDGSQADLGPHMGGWDFLLTPQSCVGISLPGGAEALFVHLSFPEVSVPPESRSYASLGSDAVLSWCQRSWEEGVGAQALD